ncbi:MAG TPA: peptidoglycan-binding protein [Candidatus Sericytochromatia bacterium]
METLAYLHLALANEASADTDYTPLIFSWDLKLFKRLDRYKLSTRATIYLLSISVAVSLLGMANQALALVQEGDRGSEVIALQQRLKQLGYFQGNVTGYFGSLTKQAVISFQQAKGLTADGLVGTNTQASLGDQPRAKAQPVQEAAQDILQLGDRGSQVSTLQESLAVAGFRSGVNGIFDEATQNAVKRFQQAKGLTVDGIVGSQTRAALPAIGGAEPSSALGTTSSGFDIKALQKRLQERGFYRGSVDGLWGPKTQAAVEAAQRAYSVSTDDIESRRF